MNGSGLCFSESAFPTLSSSMAARNRQCQGQAFLLLVLSKDNALLQRSLCINSCGTDLVMKIHHQLVCVCFDRSPPIPIFWQFAILLILQPALVIRILLEFIYRILTPPSLCFALLCYALLPYAFLCFDLLCYAWLWCALLCIALLCFALLSFSTFCFAMLLIRFVVCLSLLCFSPLLCF